MAKIGELLGLGNNSIYKTFADNRNLFSGAFGGMAANPMNPWGGFAQGAQLGGQLDTIEAERVRQEAEEAAAKNSTLEWLRSQGYDDLVAGVEGGGLDMSQAWGEGLARSRPGEAVRPIEINGQLVNPVTGQVLGDYRDPQSGFGSAPAGYQWNPDGTQSFIPGGPADPSTPAKTTEATRRNQQLASVIEPELATVEQNWAELASAGNQAGSLIPGVGNAFTSPGYQQASNALTTIAQSYLYSVSGAAATDAEVRKIVDSVTPKPFESPASIDAKLARIRQMAEAVIVAGGQQSAAPGGQTSTGLQWSIEP